jgi:hypothetical protein
VIWHFLYYFVTIIFNHFISNVRTEEVYVSTFAKQKKISTL